MTADQFAEAMRQPVGEAEDAGLRLAATIEALEARAEAMRISVEE